MKLKTVSQTTVEVGYVDAELGVDVEVSREYAWAFAARGMRISEIQNIHEVQGLVLEARKSGHWRSNWLLVSEIRRADHLTVLVARSKHARGKIRAKGKIPEPFDVPLQAEARFELSTDDIFTVANAKNTIPLYGLRKLRGIIDPQFRPIRGGDRDGDDALALEVANDEPFFSVSVTEHA